jgi:hypothetical protein
MTGPVARKSRRAGDPVGNVRLLSEGPALWMTESDVPVRSSTTLPLNPEVSRRRR